MLLFFYCLQHHVQSDSLLVGLLISEWNNKPSLENHSKVLTWLASFWNSSISEAAVFRPSTLWSSVNIWILTKCHLGNLLLDAHFFFCHFYPQINPLLDGKLTLWSLEFARNSKIQWKNKCCQFSTGKCCHVNSWKGRDNPRWPWFLQQHSFLWVLGLFSCESPLPI